jgi:GxxExxY protein
MNLFPRVSESITIAAGMPLAPQHVGCADYADRADYARMKDKMMMELPTTPAVLRMPLLSEHLTRSIIGAFYEVYNALGYGFLEHIYVLALEQELIARGHTVSRQVSVPVFYKGRLLGQQRLDMIVDDTVVIEIKSTAELHSSAHRQLRSYLKGTKLELGLLLHFGPEAKFYRVISSNA